MCLKIYSGILLPVYLPIGFQNLDTKKGRLAPAFPLVCFRSFFPPPGGLSESGQWTSGGHFHLPRFGSPPFRLTYLSIRSHEVDDTNFHRRLLLAMPEGGLILVLRLCFNSFSEPRFFPISYEAHSNTIFIILATSSLCTGLTLLCNRICNMTSCL